MITGLELDLSSARLNQAEEITGVILRIVASTEKSERSFSVRNGIVTTDPLEDDTVAIMNHRDIQITEEFVQAVCNALAVDLEGRELHEMDSTPRVRKFMLAGRRNTYMG